MRKNENGTEFIKNGRNKTDGSTVFQKQNPKNRNQCKKQQQFTGEFLMREDVSLR